MSNRLIRCSKSSENRAACWRALAKLNQKKVKKIVRGLQPGDHLISGRNVYTHHGLYLGGDFVIHYSGFADGFTGGQILVASLDEFCNGNSLAVKKYSSRLYDPEESIARAYERLGEDEYSLVFNNCEHFVNWCITGKNSSDQVDRATSIVDVAANAAALKVFNKAGKAHLFGPTVAKTVLNQGAGSYRVIAPLASNGLTKTAVSTLSVGSSGLFTASATSGAMAAVGLVSGASLATIAAPAVVAGVAIYGVGKLWDLIWD